MTLRTLGTNVAALNNAFVADPVGYDIVILAGQSNMSGRGVVTNPSVTDPSNSRIFQWKTHGTTGIQPATEPLDMHDNPPTGIGPGLQFARWYASRRLVGTNRKILLVPVAHGGTPLVSGVALAWRRGVAGNLYANMVTQALAAKAAADAVSGTVNRFVAFLWSQGETDGDNAVTGANYKTDLDALLAGIRTDLSATSLPEVILTMVPEYLTTGTRADINKVHRDAPRRVAGVDVATGATASNNGDGNHYNAAGQRLNGRAMYDAFERITQGLSPYYEDASVGTIATVTAVAASATSLDVSWTAATNAASYLVEYRLTGAGSWTSAGSTATTLTTLTGLTQDAAYDVRVTPTGVLGDTGTAQTGTGTPTPPPTVLGVTTGGVKVAYSVSRRVVSTYAGALVRVRRSSDNTEQDIGQSASALDTTALTTFLSSSDGYVVTLYDQSGNARHLTQATTTMQPKIATAGTLITSGSKAAITFDGVDDLLGYTGGNPGIYSAGAATAFQVLSATTGGPSKRIWADSSSLTANEQYGLLQPDGSGTLLTRVVPVATSAIVASNVPATLTAFNSAIHQMSSIDTGSAVSQWIDAASDVSAFAYTRGTWTNARDRFAIGGVLRNGSAANFAMTFSELVVWGAALGTTDRTTAQSNQKTQFGTP